MSIDILSNVVITDFYNASYNRPCITKSKTIKHGPIWSIFIKQTGTTSYEYEDKKFISDKNCVLIIPPDICYKWDNIIPGDYSCIAFGCNFEYNDIISVACDNPQKILNRIRMLEHIKSSPDKLCKTKCIKETYELIIDIISSAQKKYATDLNKKRFEPVIEYIEKNYFLDLSNETLANLTRLSVSHFRKTFAFLYGISPMHYVHKVRIEKAKTLLFSKQKITHIATNVGYQDIYDFSRAFKRVEGISPSKYRTLFGDGH